MSLWLIYTTERSIKYVILIQLPPAEIHASDYRSSFAGALLMDWLVISHLIWLEIMRLISTSCA
jgi:hypothetical protein